MLRSALWGSLPLTRRKKEKLAIRRNIWPSKEGRNRIIVEHFKSCYILLAFIILLILFIFFFFIFFYEIHFLECFEAIESHIVFLCLSILPNLNCSVITLADDVFKFRIDSHTLHKPGVFFEDPLVSRFFDMPDYDSFVHSRRNQVF